MSISDEVSVGRSRRNALSEATRDSIYTLRTIAATIAISAAMAIPACSVTPTAGFWYQGDALILPAEAAPRLSGTLTNEEMRLIEDLSRAEIEHAFSGVRVDVTASHRAFWRVAVVQSLPRRPHQPLPDAGESEALGFLGGAGAVGFDVVATAATQYSPVNASRQRVVEAIGRGIGRVAVHEFMHQMLGPAVAHNSADVNSYEFGSADRPSQYYGELHWTTAWPLLERKFGLRKGTGIGH
jgi:hypothetical protein